MADQNEVVYKLTVDTSGTNTEPARKSLESLKLQILQTEAEVAKLKAGIKAGTTTFVEAAGPLSQHETKLRALRVTYNELGRSSTGIEGFTSKLSKQFALSLGPIEGLLGKLGPLGNAVQGVLGKLEGLGQSSKAGAAGIGTLNEFALKAETSAQGASRGIGSLVAGLSPIAVVAGLAGAALVEFGGELIEVAAHVELVEKKARLLYGDSFPAIDQAARENANAIGLTRIEYLALASSQQQVFDALGLTKEQTQGLTPELLKLADGLADFSGGQLDTAQAAEILTNAIKGNTKGLSELGIPIKRSQDDLARLSAELQKNEHLTKDQADALATTKLVFEQVGATITKFSDGQQTLADRTDEINAKFREQKEELASALAPAFNVLTSAAGSYFSVLAKGLKGDLAGASLSQAVLGARLAGHTKEAEALQKVIDATNSVSDATGKHAKSIDQVVNQQTIEAASTDKLIAKQKELLNSRDQFAAQGKTAFANDFQKEADQVGAVIKSRQEEAATTQRLGSTYAELQSKLTALQETRKTIAEHDTVAIKESNTEIEAVQKRVKVFELAKVKESETVKASETFIKAQKDITIAYELTSAKIRESVQSEVITQTDGQRMLLELEVGTAEGRIKAKEDLAKADGKITAEEQTNILSLNHSLGEAKLALADYVKSLDQGIKNREAEVKIRIALDGANINKEIADAVAFDDLSKDFEKAFASTANSVGNDLRSALLSAMQDGTVDFEGLIKNGSVPKGLVEDLQKAYEKFKLTTERNRLQLVKSEDEAALTRLKEKFDELIKKRAELTAKKETSLTDVQITFTDKDEQDLKDTEQALDDLDGKVVQASVKVSADTSALGEVEKALKPDEKGKGKKKKDDDPAESPLAKLFGLDDDSTSFLIDKATELTEQISDIFIQGERDRNERALQIRLDAIAAERDERVRAIQDEVDSGLISQQDANTRRKLADKDAAQASLAVKKEAFEKEKKLKRAEAVIAFATELVGIASTAPQAGLAAPVYYAIQAGIAAARFAVNIGAINSAQFAERGAIVQAQRGQIAQGPSHADGGIQGVVRGQQAVELEGEEAIINKKSTKAFAPLLSAINAHDGNGVEFAPSDPIVLEQLVDRVLPQGRPSAFKFAHGGITHHSTSTNFTGVELAKARLSTSNNSSPIPLYAKGGITNTSTSSTPFPTFSNGGRTPSVVHGVVDSTTVPTFTKKFAAGGMVPAVFADGGRISLIPSEGTIANRRQLEQAVKTETTRVIPLRGEEKEKQVVVYLSELSAKTSRRKDTIDRVSYGA